LNWDSVKTSSTNKQAVLSANEASHAAGQLKINPPAKTNLSARGLLDSGDVRGRLMSSIQFSSSILIYFEIHPDFQATGLMRLKLRVLIQ
jgi:hypothetical protein